MANKKVSQLTSKPSVLVTDLFPIADPSTGQLYKTTISDLGTAIGSGVSSVNGLVGAVVLDTDDIQELVSPTNKWFTDTRARAALSASSPLAYNSGTGVFSIPAATSSQNGYLTSTDWTTFNSKQAALSGTGFVKISGTTISYDNSTYLTTSDAASTYLALAGGTMTGNLLLPANNTVGGTNYYIGQTMASNDFWRIYGNTVAEDQGEMIFELGDNATPIGSNGQRFKFNYSASSSGTAKTALLIDYDISTFTTSLVATSATFSGDVYIQESGNAVFRVHAATNTSPVADIELMRGTNTTWGADAYGDYRLRSSEGDFAIQYGDSGTTSTRFTLASTGAATFSSSVTAASVIISGASATEQFRIGNTTGGTALGFTVTENSTTVINSAEGGTGRGIQFQSGGSNTMIITSAGDLGIGVTSVSARLHTSTTTAGNSIGALFANPNQAGTADSVSINFGLGRTVDSLLFSIPAITFGKEQQWTSTGSTVDGYLSFSTMLNETASERMRIKSNGIINLSNVPTSSAGLSSGDIYKSAGVLMIV
jgi:hypothetical protein